MTTLNWERDRSQRQARDTSTDFPPLTGSTADQRRYGVYHGGSRGSNRQPSLVSIKNRADDFDQLACYAKAVGHSDFLRKGHSQRSELIGILRKLVARSEGWGGCASEHEVDILARARVALKSRMQ